jgi:hypothetical protein
MQPPESRRHQRFLGTLTVQVVAPVTSTFGTLYEVSTGGAFLEVSPLPPIGAVVTLHLLVDGKRSALEAEVRYRMSTEVGPRGLEGVGLSWLDPGPEQRALIELLVGRAQEGRALRGE